MEQDKFNFIWYIINELKAIEFFRLLIKKQPNFINVLDENLNSLFSLACDQYLENYDPYYLTLIAVILESNNFMLNKIELEIIESKINQELTHNTQYPLQIKRLSLLLNHYFGKDKENFELTNAANTITKVPLITETSPYDEILYKPDYFERLDLSSLYTVSFLSYE